MAEQVIVGAVVALAGLWAARRIYRSLRRAQTASACGTGCSQPCAGAPSHGPSPPCANTEEESAHRGSY